MKSVITSSTLSDNSRQECQSVSETLKPISYTRRNVILAIVTLSGLLAPMASTIYLPSLIHIGNDFDASKSELDLSVSGYLFTVGISPLFWGALSDTNGRRWVALVSQFIMILASLGCALANSMNLLIAMRIIKAVGASACSVSGIGTISDLFSSEEKGAAMGIFFIGPMFGPSLGPLIGGIINEYGHWRYVFWFLTAVSSLLLVATFFWVPETLVRTEDTSMFIRTKAGMGFKFNGPFPNPLSTLALFRFPKILAILMYAGIIYGSYYNISLSQTSIMHDVYHLSSSSTGLTYLAIGGGNIIGSYMGGKVSDLIYNRHNQVKGGLKPRPEARLHSCWPGAILIMVGLALNGTFIEYKFHLASTLAAQFLVGLGMASVFTTTSAYLTDLCPTQAASVTACTNFMRNAVSGIVTSFSSPLMAAIGPFYLFLIFSLIQIFGLIILFCLTFFTRLQATTTVRPATP